MYQNIVNSTDRVEYYLTGNVERGHDLLVVIIDKRNYEIVTI